MDDGNLDHCSNDGGVENWSYSGHILRVKLVELADGFNEGMCEKGEWDQGFLAYKGTELTFIEIEENWERGNRVEEEDLKTDFTQVKFEMS